VEEAREYSVIRGTAMGEIGEWLKNSIPGIVILGAIGSICAVLVLHLVGRFFRGPLKWLARWFVEVEGKIAYTHGFVLGRAAAANDLINIIVYLSFQILLCLLLAIVSSTFLLVFLAIFLVGNDAVLSGASYSALVICMVCAYFTFTRGRLVFYAYRKRLWSDFSDAAKAREKRRKQAILGDAPKS
jgi:hypothetical protein